MLDRGVHYKKLLLKRLPLISLGVIAYILTKYAQNHQDWAEKYSRSVYPLLSKTVGLVPSWVTFSVSEWLVVLVVLLFLFYIVYYVRKVIMSKGARRMVVYRGALGIVTICSVIYFVILFWVE